MKNTLAQAFLDALEKKKKIDKTGVPFLVVHHAEKIAHEEKREAQHQKRVAEAKAKKLNSKK